MNNISTFSLNECCGCGGCSLICPKHAITMVQGENGFSYPSVNCKKCISCGLCLKTCDFKWFEPANIIPACYAARHKSDEEVSTSRSGGFFMALCDYVTSRGGVCFGSVLDDNCFHKYARIYEECKNFKGSKYVQSDTRKTFSECADFLKKGELVLYSGTGCQVHGLLRFLDIKNVPTDQLITVDIVCHGVPSPGVWKNYMAALQEKVGKIVRVDFRDKSINGWSDHIETYTLQNGDMIHSKAWTTVFYRHILFRESCYNCKYTTTNRNSDFTIADYWGIGKNAPEFDDNKGVSLVLVHSSKAKDIFNDVKDKLNYKETNIKTSLQPQLCKPIWKGWDYWLFWFLYRKSSEKAIRIFFFPDILVRTVWQGEKCIKGLIKSVITAGKRSKKRTK